MAGARRTRPGATSASGFATGTSVALGNGGSLTVGAGGAVQAAVLVAVREALGAVDAHD